MEQWRTTRSKAALSAKTKSVQPGKRTNRGKRAAAATTTTTGNTAMLNTDIEAQSPDRIPEIEPVKEKTTHLRASDAHGTDVVIRTDEVDSIEVMARMTRSGASTQKILKRFRDIENEPPEQYDKDSMFCIMGCGRKKNAILLPCRHQHTCERCWFMYKVHQINSIPDDAFDDIDSDDEVHDNHLKPKCPMCKTPVDQEICAYN